jgi:transcriptional regulator GlxA family with amidase domain
MSISAKPVFFVLYDGVELLDLAGPAEVFSQANTLLGSKAYDIHYVSAHNDRPVQTTAGLPVCATALPRKVDAIDTVFVPGAELPALEAAIADPKLMDWLRRTLPKSDRIASVCTGAFILGALGKLDKRRVTTHWAGIEQLQQMFPAAQVQNDTLYINDDELWTSAGVLSGVDMALAIVSQDHSRSLALEIARLLVVYLFRDGGQTQFSAPIDMQSKAAQSDLLRLTAWLLANVDKAISVEAMADYMSTSVRSLHRHCQDVFGISPAKLFVELRLEHARSLLNSGELSVKTVALNCGYGSAAAFSKAFKQRYGVGPGGYRTRFA